MKSLRELYTVGRGPSSSHTIGPARACCLFREEHPDADRYEVALFGSLALTGRGHLTDVAVRDALAPVHTDILWNTERTDLPHPNTMELRAYKNGALTGEMTALSVGGGAISIPGRPDTESPEVYPETSYAEISAFCSANRLRLSDYVFLREGEEIRDYLYDIWNTMKLSVSDGLTRTGELPGGLEVERKAQYLYNRRHIDESPQTRENRLVCAYAFAVAEQNASGGEIVTAPTCGASGVMPAALLYMQEERGFSDEAIVRALAAGGVIGDLIKTNASISGAECGCQAEIGSACSMTAAALGELFDTSGTVGSPGELKGRFLSTHALGSICINSKTGVYGRTRAAFSGPELEMAFAQEVVPGDAEIWTTVDGEVPKAYRIRIEKVNDADPHRNMILRVTDRQLLAKTGGIVQGMSGSPILQNGRLVGAVTHVLVNDPTRGYGIFAQTMLKQARAVEKTDDAAQP